MFKKFKNGNYMCIVTECCIFLYKKYDSDRPRDNYIQSYDLLKKYNKTLLATILPDTSQYILLDKNDKYLVMPRESFKKTLRDYKFNKQTNKLLEE